jgi:hypothetical protein
MSDLPPRTADTMSDAIALSSPNGRMSNRARRAAERKLSDALFGPGGLTWEKLKGPPPPEPTPAERAVRLREYARMAGSRQAKKLIAQAEALEAQAA